MQHEISIQKTVAFTSCKPAGRVNVLDEDGTVLILPILLAPIVGDIFVITITFYFINKESKVLKTSDYLLVHI